MYLVFNKDIIYYKIYWIFKNFKDCKKIYFVVRVNLEFDIIVVCYIF